MSRLDGLRAGLGVQVRSTTAWVDRLRESGRGQRGSIGLHWADKTLQLVQMAHGSEGLEVAAAAQASLPGASDAEEDSFAREVRRALRAHGFRGRRIVTTLEPPDVKLMVLDYAGSDDGADAAIVHLVEERIGESADEVVIDYLPIRALGDSPSQRSALVAVARRERVVERLESLRRAGLEVDALEITPVAIRRLVSGLGPRKGRDENALALYGGLRRGHLIVLWGRRLVLYREFDFGAATAEERLAKALDLGPGEAADLLHRHGVAPPAPGEADADPAGSHEVAGTIQEILKPCFYQLADEIERARVYTASRARGAAPERAYLLGAFASWPRAERLLESVGPLPVTSLDLAGWLGSDAAIPSATVAAGLALRGMLDDG